MASQMRIEYEQRVLPRFEAAHHRAPRDGLEVRKSMLPNPYFRAWSALRYTAQEMTWSSVRPMIERSLPQMIAAARSTATAAHTLGSLRLDPDLKIPRDMQQLDIHLMPGGFHTEQAPDDVAAGALYTHGTAVFAGGFALRARGGGVAKSIAKYLEAAFPAFRPRKILDLGCTTGANLLPYLEVFPDAEGYGVDVGAPLLRYAHARAESLNMRVHYSQQDAQSLDFPDEAFDIVCSSFFLHAGDASGVQGSSSRPEAGRRHGTHGAAAVSAHRSVLFVLSGLGRLLQQRAALRCLPGPRSGGRSGARRLREEAVLSAAHT
jgi:SAM-dependent methyltransferase